MSLLIEYMSHDACPILNLFIDWNPLYADDYNVSLEENNPLYVKKSHEEVCLFAKL
jgi:hypothetical protein